MGSSILLSLKPPSSPPLLSFPSTPTPTTQHLSVVKTQSFPKIPLSSSKKDNNTAAERECPVPVEQQPTKEYEALSTSFPFSWASGDVVEYSSRLFAMGACFALFVGLPVSWAGSIGPNQPFRLLLTAASSGLFVVLLAVVRMYLGWAYVDEETGWYDGQIWIKSAEVLARDRLLGSFSVKPVLSRLKNTLVSLGTTLFVSLLVLINSGISQKPAYIAPVEPGGRAVPGVYNDESARHFEPDAFCGGESASP